MDSSGLREAFGSFEHVNIDSTFESRVVALAISERAQELKTGFMNDLYQDANPEKMMWVAGNNVDDRWRKLARAELIMMGREMPEFFDALTDIYRYKQLLIDETGSLEEANSRINSVFQVVNEVATPIREAGGIFDPAEDWENIVKKATEKVDINPIQSDALLQLFSATVNMGIYYSKHQNLFVTNPGTGMFRTIYFGEEPLKLD